MSTKFSTTLRDLRKHGACFDRYNKVVRSLQGKSFSDEDSDRNSYIHLAHEEQISIESILAINGLDGALWALRCIPNADRDRDIRLYGVWCARQIEYLMTDQRSKDALDVAERYANGQATDDELNAARYAAYVAACVAARDAACDAACDAAYVAAYVAACDAAYVAQTDMLIKMCQGVAPWQVGHAG